MIYHKMIEITEFVLGGRFELPILSEHAPKACAYANSATRAYNT